MEHCKLFSICPIVSNTSATLGSIHATKCVPGQYISSGPQIKIKNIIFPFDLVLIWKEDTQITLQICLFTHNVFTTGIYLFTAKFPAKFQSRAPMRASNRIFEL